MKKKLCFLIATLLLFFGLGINGVFVKAESSKFFTIGANPAEDCNTSMNIVWHTEVGITDSYVVCTKVSDENWNEAEIVNGVATLNSAFAGKNAKYGTSKDSLKYPYEFMKNEATITDLEPGTKYKYKITDGTLESDTRYFKTGDQEFTFVWVSDFHAYYEDARRLNNATLAVNQCISLSNNTVDFVLSTGDTIAHGGTYEWWKQVSEASWVKSYMVNSTLGNHDWMTNVGTYYDNGASFGFFDACYNNPKNGFSGQENICYYFYYGDALFINVNTEVESAYYLGMTTAEFVKAQQDWVESVLQNNTAQYIFMMQHYQAFSTNGGYNSAGYSRWHDICDKYGVDVFFTGNSHVYMRSLPIYKDKVSTDQSKGTVYLVAPSSDGDRGVEYKPHTSHTDQIVKSWSDSRAIAASLVKVTQDGISLRLVDSNGNILDTARILPKRGPSERTYKDLADFDKNQFEASFNIQVNQKSLSTPKVLFSSDAYNVLRSYKIYNKDTNEVYYDGVLKEGSSNLVLEEVEKGILNIGVELRYFDSTVKELTFEVNNNLKWGNVSNASIVAKNDNYYLNWNGSIQEDKVSKIEILVDGNLYKEISSNEKEILLPLDESLHVVILNIYDIEGDLVYHSSELEYQLIKYYEVKFVDEDGNILKTEQVKSGEKATAPSYNPKEGFEFVSWDKDFSKVESDLIIKVILKEKEPEIVDPTPVDPIDDPTPITPPDDKTSGCGSGAIITIWQIIIPLGLIVLFKRRYN